MPNDSVLTRVVKSTKLQLDDDFNIIDPEAQLRKQQSVENLKQSLSAARSRQQWLLDDLHDCTEEIKELEETLKGYGEEINND